MTDNKANTAGKKDPIIKIYKENGDDFLSKGTIIKIIVYGLCIALIILGSMFNIVALSVIGMFVFILFTVVLILLAVKNKTAREYETDKYIEEEIESFQDDLVHTMYSYDLSYTSQDIEEATEKYKNILEQETANIADMDESDLQFIIDTLKRDKKTSKKNTKAKKFDKTKQEPGFLNEQ